MAKGLSNIKISTNQGGTEVNPEQQRREFVQKSETALAYRLEENGNTFYKVFTLNNNSWRPVILKEYPPDGVIVKDNSQEVYAAMKHLGAGKTSGNSPISPKMPRISQKMPRIR